MSSTIYLFSSNEKLTNSRCKRTDHKKVGGNFFRKTAVHNLIACNVDSIEHISSNQYLGMDISTINTDRLEAFVRARPFYSTISINYRTDTSPIVGNLFPSNNVFKG